MKKLAGLFYAGLFLPIFLVIRILTVVMKAVGFKAIVRLAHRAARLRNRVLYLEAFFPENAGYHYRTQKWIDVLNDNGFTARARHVFEGRQFDGFFKDEKVMRFQAIYMIRRIWHCLVALTYNCVIVRRELLLFNDYGNLFLDRFLLVAHPSVILDFDDDLSAAKREPRARTAFGRLMFESPSKFSESLTLYSRFIAGSNYLKLMVVGRNPLLPAENIITIPTCVDYERYPGKVYNGRKDCITFGWVGSNTTMAYLDIVIPALNEISERHNIKLLVVSGQDYKADVVFEIQNLRWDLANEIDNLRRIDIGLMPLYDTAVEKGKCGFKVVQYMGIGIVSVASAVTANAEIIDDNRNGFLVHDARDWARVLEEVLSRQETFPAISIAARRKIAEKFSIEANSMSYLDFVRSACNGAQN